jgi:hypothetical protein
MDANVSAVLAARDLSTHLDPDRVLMSGPVYDERRRRLTLFSVPTAK